MGAGWQVEEEPYDHRGAGESELQEYEGTDPKNSGKHRNSRKN